MKRQAHLTDPLALRAYAHPTRMALVGLLRREGPLTATQAAERTGESVASCSYHLRILAKYGLVEEAPPGPGREKPWRATAEFTDWPGYSEDPTVAAAAEALTVAVAENFLRRMTAALETRSTLSREWQEAERYSDITIYLTAEELTAIGEQIDALLTGYIDRAENPALRPEGARRVPFLQLAFAAPEPEPVPGPAAAPKPDAAHRPGAARQPAAPEEE